MTGAEFRNTYKSDDADDWQEQEDYMRNLGKTIQHFLTDREPTVVQVGADAFVEQPPTLQEFANWLNTKADE